MDLKRLIPMSFRYRLMELRGRSIYSGYPNKYRCVFVHIPKTAGTSVVGSLFDQDSRHVRWTEYQQANPRKFDKYFKFCFVRNPWDRLLSAYLFLRQGGMNETDSAWAKENINCFDSFESFVHDWLTEESIWSWVHFLPQYYWVCDDNQKCQMDFIGRMEQIKSDFRYVADRLHSTALLPIKNRTRSDHYSSHYTAEMRAIVERVYFTDIEMFDYQFEGLPR